MTRPVLGWFLVGTLVGFALAWLPAATAATGPLAPLVAGQEGYVEPDRPRLLHDGAFAYAMAVRPFTLEETAQHLDNPSYRYRRILYPLLAGGGGLVAPEAALAGLALWASVGMGLGAAALRHLSDRLGARPWAVMGAIANFGLWGSVIIATPDALALGLALVALALWLEGRRGSSVLCLAASALAKETYLLVAAGLALAGWSAGRRREALAVALLPACPVLAWSGYVALRLGGALTDHGNLTLPLAGIVRAIPHWSVATPLNLVFTAATLGAVALGVLALRRPPLGWWAAPWLAVALVSTELVWGFGNNSIRVLAPLWAIGMLALARSLPVPAQPTLSTSRRNLPV